jgi:hypothetical protein
MSASTSPQRRAASGNDTFVIESECLCYGFIAAIGIMESINVIIIIINVIIINVIIINVIIINVIIIISSSNNFNFIVILGPAFWYNHWSLPANFSHALRTCEQFTIWFCTCHCYHHGDFPYR